MKGALRPEPLPIRSVWNEEDISPKTGISLEDEEYASLASHSGWLRLKEHIAGLKESLDLRLTESVLKGLGDGEIQKDALFAVLGKELLNSIVHKVEDSKETVEQINNEREQRKTGNTGS